MKSGRLKAILNESRIKDIITLAKDPTLGKTRIDQIQGMIYKVLTGLYWDEVEDNVEVITGSRTVKNTVFGDVEIEDDRITINGDPDCFYTLPDDVNTDWEIKNFLKEIKKLEQ